MSENTTKNSDLRAAALAYLKGGLCIIPIDAKTKKPAQSWSVFQKSRPTAAKANQWFGRHKAAAVVCGNVSGGLLVLDFDVADFYEAWKKDVGKAAEKLPTQRTGGGGFQVWVRCPSPGRNEKLAYTIDEEGGERRVAIETRGEGGYAIIAPSLHPSGKRYKVVHGDFRNIPSISQAEAARFLAVARKLDRCPQGATNSRGSGNLSNDPNRINACQEFIEKICPDAISGCGGHDATFEAACECYRHGLDDRAALSVMQWYNSEKCDPPWKLTDLQHKLADARKQVEADRQLGSRCAARLRQRRELIRPEAYRPFPLHALPPVLADLASRGAEAIGCPVEYIAVPALVACAAAIGNAARIELKRGWQEPPVIWAAIVGESGTLKSPALDCAVGPTRYRQAKTIEAHKELINEYKQKVRDAKQSGKPIEDIEKPPPLVRITCGDTTVEALAVLLQSAPGGLLLERDELSGWLESFDQYKGGRGGDIAHWLTIHRAGNLLVDRKTGDERTISVPRAAVSVTGGIQPKILQRVMREEFLDSGLVARLLLVMPPHKQKRWTESTISANTQAKYEELIFKLYGLANQHCKDPIVLPLTSKAKQAWIAFYNDHARQQAQLNGNLAAAWSKLEGYAPRFALVVHCIRATFGDAEFSKIDRASIEAGVELCRWFGHETKRVYAFLAANPEESDRLKLVEYIQSKRDSITARDLGRHLKRYEGGTKAEDALQDLVHAGYGVWNHSKPSGSGGRPSKVFKLNPAETGQ